MDRIKNSILNHEEYMRDSLILSSYPRFLFLELTRNCNLHCSMCRPYNLYKNEWFMSDKVLERVSDQLFSYVEVVDLRGFGESTLDPRLLQIASDLENQGVSTYLFSNMCTQDATYWKTLGKIGTKVAISIETANKEKYRKIRRGGELHVFKKNVISLVENAINKPYFSVVVSDSNFSDLIDLVFFSKECGISKIQLNPISYNKPGEIQTHYGLNIFECKQVCKILEELQVNASENGVEIEIAANLCNENNVKKKKCLHPWSYVFVKYDGSIGFCDHLARVDEAILGNIMEQDFMEIWNNDEYIRLRRNHCNANFEELINNGIECDWCKKNRYANCENEIESEIKPLALTDYIKEFRSFFVQNK